MSTTTDLEKIRETVKNKLDTINETFLGSITENVLGNGSSGRIKDIFEANKNKFQINGAKPYVTTVTNSTIKYTPINLSSYSLNSKTDVLEINCMAYLKEEKDVKFMRGLYALYAMFDGKNWPSFVAALKASATPSFNFDIYVPVYNSSSGGSMTSTKTNEGTKPNTTELLKAVSSKLITKLQTTLKDKNNTFNPFIAQRIVRMWILLFHYAIAKSVNDTKLMKLCHEIIRKVNQDVSYSGSKFDQPVFNELKTIIDHENETYKTNLISLSILSGTVNATNTDIKATTNKINDRNALAKKQAMYEFVAIALLVCIATAAVFLMTFPLDQTTKYGGCGVLIIVAAVNAFVLNAVLKSTTSETFIGDIDKDDLDIYVMVAVDEYLDLTLLLSSMVDQYGNYLSMNSAIHNQLDYYNDQTSVLNMSVANLNSQYNSSFHTQVKYSALMELFKNLSIVIALMATGFVAANDMPSVQSYVLGFAIVLGLIAIAVYILEITARVRTKPKKYYWGKPTVNG